jgi:hypothetical protein
MVFQLFPLLGMENALFSSWIGVASHRRLSAARTRSISMRTCGIKLLDSVLGMVQIEWLLVPAEECRDAKMEDQLVRMHFRKPHEPWGANGAFVLPVAIRRSRRRVLFFQESGLQF